MLSDLVMKDRVEFWPKLTEMLWGLLEQLPSLLTIVACMIVAALRWKRHPRVSLMVLIALLLIVVHAFVFAAVYEWVPDLLLKDVPGNRANVIRNVFLGLGMLYHATLAIPFAMLLVGISGMRGGKNDGLKSPAVALAA